MISSDSHFFTNEEGATVLKSFEKSYLSKPGPIISRYLSTKIRFLLHWVSQTLEITRRC